LSNTGCQQLYETGTLSLGDSTIISEALPNSTITSSNVAGSITVDGLLWNPIDPYEIWDNGIVQAIIKIVFKDYEVLIKRASLQLILSSGQRCDTR